MGNEGKEKWFLGRFHDYPTINCGKLCQQLGQYSIYEPIDEPMEGRQGCVREVCQVPTKELGLLFIAAPDLAKAAEAVLEWWDSKDQAYEREPEFVTLARSALAKARGGES